MHDELQAWTARSHYARNVLAGAGAESSGTACVSGLFQRVQVPNN